MRWLRKTLKNLKRC